MHKSAPQIRNIEDRMSSNTSMSIPTRSNATYSPRWDRFIAPSGSSSPDSTLAVNGYNKQYSSLYTARLSQLRQKCLEAIPSDARNNTKVVSRIIELCDIEEEKEEHVIVIGTVVKENPNRPALSIYSTVSSSSMQFLSNTTDGKTKRKKKKKVVDPPLRHYCDLNKDFIFLEDDSGRVELNCDNVDIFDSLRFVTGVVIAIYGQMNTESGVMHVENAFTPKLDTLSSSGVGDSDDEASILFVSDLDCGGVDEDESGSSISLKREMLIDYITGHFTSEEGANICRVIIAGGGCSKQKSYDNLNPLSWKKKNKSSDDIDDSDDQTLPAKQLDLFLSELCNSGVPVDFIPGLFDPTNANWPQMPMHPCLLPNAECFVNMLSRSTNPYEALINNKLFLGSDGLNVTDVRRFMANRIHATNEGKMDLGIDLNADEDSNNGKDSLELVSALDALRSTLVFRHIAPTGPDSIPMYPFVGKDPFVIDQIPHVYFAGNQDKFETGCFNETRLICIPSFAKTGQAVLLNITSLDCKIIQFDDVPSESTEVFDK